MKRKIKVLGNIISTLIVVGVLAFAVLNFFSDPDRPYFLGYKGYTVISGSMEPTLRVGDYILVKDRPFESLKPDEVISFNNDQIIVTHRIEKVLADQSLITRGDANTVDDLLAVTKKEYIGTYQYRIPSLGKLLMWFQQPLVFSLIMAAIATRFAVLLIFKK